MAKSKKTNSLINEKSLEFLKSYINTPSPVGFETGGQKIWLNYIKDHVDTTFTDAYGTAVGVINPGKPFKVVIEAHADEISWFVNYISPEGFIYLKRNGGFVPGIKPGKTTAEFIDGILSRITLPGALFLAAIAVLPAFAVTAGVGQNFAQFFGGTSLLILVGVVLDTLQQIESYLLMRHYEGMMKSGRVKGRSQFAAA